MKMMMNWKTTLAGIGVGAGYAILSALQSGLTLKDALIAAGIAVLGALAKDGDVTGVGPYAERH